MAMTQAERDAEDAKALSKELAEAPRRLRKENEFNPVTVDGVTITPTDKTLARLYAIVVSGRGVKGWRADNGVFNLTNAEAQELYEAGNASVAKAFIAQAAIENTTYDTIKDVEAAFDTAYKKA